MSKTQKRRAVFLLLIGLSSITIVLLVLYALKQNLNLFYTPSQAIVANLAPNSKIRLGGVIKENSLVRVDGLKIKFVVSDSSNDITTYYNGVVPDLFREGQTVVALGNLNEHGDFIAEQILAKHDENYRPPGV